MEEFRKILADNAHIFDMIATIVKSSGELPEGNCVWQHNTMNKKEELLTKQYNLYTLGQAATNILEIGFNAGHSCLLFLLSNTTSTITLFDIGSHKYVLPCYNYLSSIFPNRLHLIIGNSLETVPAFTSKNPDIKFDLMHIDGYHHVDHVRQEILNVRKCAATNNIVILDDDWMPQLKQLHREYIKQNILKLHNDNRLKETSFYSHLVCSYV